MLKLGISRLPLISSLVSWYVAKTSRTWWAEIGSSSEELSQKKSKILKISFTYRWLTCCVDLLTCCIMGTDLHTWCSSPGCRGSVFWTLKVGAMTPWWLVFPAAACLSPSVSSIINTRRLLSSMSTLLSPPKLWRNLKNLLLYTHVFASIFVRTDVSFRYFFGWWGHFVWCLFYSFKGPFEGKSYGIWYSWYSLVGC